MKRFWLAKHLAVIAVAACVLGTTHAEDFGAGNRINRAEQGEPVWQSRPGPWGELEIRAIYLEAPTSYISALKRPAAKPAWFLPAKPEAGVRELLTRAKLPDEMRERLLATENVTLADGIITLHPSVADIESLTVEQRSLIYAELARVPLNTFYKTPAYATGGNVDDWVEDARLPDAQKARVKQLIWYRGKLPAFSDVSVLLSHAESSEEVKQIFKFMTRVRTLVVELKVPTDADLAMLAQYWGGERLANETLPLLESAVARASIASLDISHLLPSIARRRLYTFPTTDLAVAGRLPDCHWTSLNFFNPVAADYYLDSRLARSHILEDYTPVDPPYRFGDVLMFQNAADEGIHSCVFIADDIVFTKNGGNLLKPWLLMWLPNLKMLYDVEGPVAKIQGYRLKPGAL